MTGREADDSSAQTPSAEPDAAVTRPATHIASSKATASARERGESVIETASLGRTYNKGAKHERVALRDANLLVARGERVALLGPNGSGKSTLLRIIATLDRQDTGDVSLFGANVESSQVRTIRARLGVVFQEPGLDRLLTIRENLLTQASLYGIGGASATSRVHAVAEQLGLFDRLNDRVGALSGGLARRADLARALLHEPELLLLDEPSTGLDPRAREEFLDTLDQLSHASAGRLTVLMSTHLMDEAERCDRVVMMDTGRIAAEGAPGDLRRRLGAMTIRCRFGRDRDADAHLATVRSSLANQGFEELKVARADEVRFHVGGADAERVAAAIEPLIQLQASFEVGPPTLADVFFSVTGCELNGEVGEPAKEHRKRRAGATR